MKGTTNKDRVFTFLQKLGVDHADESYTTTYLAEVLELQRSNVSALLNQLVKEKRVDKSNTRPVKFRVANLPNAHEAENSAFKRVVGSTGSLRASIQLLKAAVVYPAYPLPALLLGPIGSGKEYMAHIMQRFAADNGVIATDAPLNKVNCTVYKNDAEKLENVLFRQKDAIFQKAIGGILYLENINDISLHVLNLLVDEMSTISHQQQKVVLIASVTATDTKQLEPDIIQLFSIQVNLPALNNRPLAERFELIQNFFGNESKKMKREIKIDSDVLRGVLLYRCDGNINQLESDIKLGCANAYVRELTGDTTSLNVYINDFPAYVSKGFLYYEEHRSEVDKLVQDNYTYSFSPNKMQKVEMPTVGDGTTSIYDSINQRVYELKKRGVLNNDISSIISQDFAVRIKDDTTNFAQDRFDRNALEQLVDNDLIVMVEQFLNRLSRDTGVVYESSIYYGLCLHLSSILNGTTAEVSINQDQIKYITREKKREYLYCTELADQIDKVYHHVLSTDEIMFITMYLTTNQQTVLNDSQHPSVLIAMHGSSTASSITAVTNSLIRSNNVYAFDLDLNQDIKDAYDELKTKIEAIDSGNGVVLIYDMGSIKKMAETIQQETQIDIKLIEIPITLIALDVARKANILASAEDVQADVLKSFKDFFIMGSDYYQRDFNQKLIITLSMGGTDAAVSMKNYLEENVDLENTGIVPLTITSQSEFVDEIGRLQEKHEIVSIIGTYDPKVFGIPFISITKLFNTPKDKLSMLIATETLKNHDTIDYNLIYEHLSEQIPQLEVKKLQACLPQFIKQIQSNIVSLTKDEELELFIHIVYMIDRVTKDIRTPLNVNDNQLIDNNKTLFNDLKDDSAGIEKTFDIQIPDSEIANIIGLIKQV